jgi:hypothetical protein
MVDPVVAVKTLLLQEAMPDLVLRPGSSVVARVASRGDHHGVLVLAGVPLTAQLPEEAKAGDTLRLHVSEVTADRVTLRMDGPPLLPAPDVPPRPPSERSARVAVQDPPRRRTAGGEDVSSVALAFQSRELGRLDLRIELTSARVQVTVDAPVAVQDVLQEAAGRLRDGLSVRTERDAAVTVRARREPVDVYA